MRGSRREPSQEKGCSGDTMYGMSPVLDQPGTHRQTQSRDRLFPDSLVSPVCMSCKWEPWDCLSHTASVYLLSVLKLAIRSLTLETGTCSREGKRSLAIKETYHETMHVAGSYNPEGANSVRPKSPKVHWI